MPWPDSAHSMRSILGLHCDLSPSYYTVRDCSCEHDSIYGVDVFAFFWHETGDSVRCASYVFICAFASLGISSSCVLGVLRDANVALVFIVDFLLLS